MSDKENEKFDDKLSLTEKHREVVRKIRWPIQALLSQEVPPGVDRRNFLIRSAVGGAAAVMMGSFSTQERTAKALATLPVLPQAGRRRRSLPT